MPVHRPHYEGIPQDREIVFLASGGRDSTAMVLEAYALGLEGSMMFGDTRFNHAGLKVMERLAEYTGYPLYRATYDGDEKPIAILDESFLNLPLAIERTKKTGRFQRNAFACCDKLKHGPMDRYLESIGSQDSIQVLGIKGTDGSPHRRMRMAELRNKGQYYRIKADGSYFWYPLRDCKNSDVAMILDEHGFNGIKTSGCILCPIICMFDNFKKTHPETYSRSMQKAKRLGVVLDGQSSLMEFCGDKT